MAISRETVDKVRALARIEHIIARYIPKLTKRGNNLLGLCPFHNEKTPSFTVSPEKQIFHCFGCHEGGNVFSFIQKIENVNFPKSVEIVAELVGVPIEKSFDPKEQKRSYLTKITEFATELFHQKLLKDAKEAKSYLTNRGVEDEAIATFRLGFSPESWDFLKNALTNKQIDLEKAYEAGTLAKKKETNRYFDMFRNRIIFPISDINGTVVAFGGRIIGDGQPKYLNSNESWIFKKRSILYGLNHAYKDIREMGRAIVVEGYLDVIGCHQAGLTNTVAPLGTALTLEQLQTLTRYTSEIVLLFDSDAAGMKAAQRTLQYGKEISASIKVANLPEGDPFDYIQKHGMRALAAIIEKALSPVEFQINAALANSKDLDLVELERRVFTVIDTFDLAAERETALKKAAELLNLDYQAISLDYRKRNKAENTQDAPKNAYNSREVKPKVEKLVHKRMTFQQKALYKLIQLLVHYPELIEKALIDFSEFTISDERLKKFLNILFDAYENEEELATDMMYAYFKTQEEKSFLTGLFEKDYTVEHPDSIYTEIYLNMKIHDIDDTIRRYTNKLRQATEPGDKTRLLTEIDVWRREKEKLASYIYEKNSDKNANHAAGQ